MVHAIGGGRRGGSIGTSVPPSSSRQLIRTFGETPPLLHDHLSAPNNKAILANAVRRLREHSVFFLSILVLWSSTRRVLTQQVVGWHLDRRRTDAYVVHLVSLKISKTAEDDKLLLLLSDLCHVNEFKC